MKIIHTGDWHIGKIVNEFSMIEDQRYILNSLVKLIKEEKPDAVVIAGDVYDRSIPPVEAVELLNDIFKEILIDNKVKILAIAGNHDSAERLSFGSSILEKHGLYIVGNIEEVVKKVTLKNKDEKVNFYLIPYIEPGVLRKKYGRKDIKNHNDAMKLIIENIKKSMDNTEINVAVAHGYVTLNREEALKTSEEDRYKVADIEVSESERPLSIGGTDLIDGNIFEDFDYVALGHLHGRQKVGRESMRYSGSLLKYSFSEVNHKKGVTIVELNAKNDISIIQKELIPMRNMRVIRGPIEGLIEAGREDSLGNKDYIQAILTDQGELVDPISKLRAVYPNIMLLRKEESESVLDSLTAASQGYKNKSELDLFKEYYERLGNGEFSEEKERAVIDVIEEVIRGEDA